MIDEASGRPHERVPTGVAGLDSVLHGGFLRRGIYMLQGRPGAGKTILANQVCFHHASQGGQVLYITLLAESHERLIFNLESLSFFNPSYIPGRIAYLSAFSTLEESGLDGLVELLRREARSCKATLLVVDGLVTVEESAETKKAFKKFIHELQTHANLVGCTVLLLTGVEADPVGPEHTMVDGVLTLTDNRVGRHSERELEVRKFRGTGYLRGGHAFQITDDGVTVHPRLEGLYNEPSRPDPCKGGRVSSGIPSIDAMLEGGLPCASTTVVLGASGTGKTSLGLQFLDASSKEEPGLFFGFYERPERLLLKSRALGLGLERKVKEGVLDLIWRPPTERILDALGNQLLANVRERGVKRLFVDGADGFLQSAAHPERISHFLAALTNELRAGGVTAMFTNEVPVIVSSELELPLHGLSALAENIVLLRFVELKAHLHRMISFVKVRDSAYDSSLRELLITSKGLELADTFERAEAILTGIAAPAATPAPRRKKSNARRR